MYFFQTTPNASYQWHSCPNCNTTVGIDVITSIKSFEEFSHYSQNNRNRALCTFCGLIVEAPVRIRVKLDCEGLPDHDCVPLALLQNPEVIDDLIHNSPPGIHRVYSNYELERSIEAYVLMELRRQNIDPNEALAEYSR